MALKSTIFRLNLSVSDLDQNYYQDHALTLARHPSETDLRMILRIAVFALNAHENLVFTKGLSDADEPDIWQKSLTGDIEHWIELGQPHEKRIRQACGKAGRVSIYTYQRGADNVWFQGIKSSLDRFRQLKITHLVVANESIINSLVDRTMTLSAFIEDQNLLLSNQSDHLTIELKALKAPHQS